MIETHLLRFFFLSLMSLRRRQPSRYTEAAMENEKVWSLYDETSDQLQKTRLELADAFRRNEVWGGGGAS